MFASIARLGRGNRGVSDLCLAQHHCNGVRRAIILCCPRSYGMADDHHGSIVAFSSKIAVEQAGDDTGMSSSEPGIIFKIPVSLYTVGMHHQDTSIHQGVCEFSNPWHACS